VQTSTFVVRQPIFILSDLKSLSLYYSVSMLRTTPVDTEFLSKQAFYLSLLSQNFAGKRVMDLVFCNLIN
jgi:hypothetical protein